MEKERVSYCMSCKKEVSEDIGLCKCGGRRFVFGFKDSFELNEKGVSCKCGSDSFRGTMHMDYAHKSHNSYACPNCGNVIGTEYYRSEDEMFMWED